VTTEDSRGPGRTKTALVILALVAVPVAALLITMAIQGPGADAEIGGMNRGIRFVVGVFLAVLGALATVGSYLLVLLTTCFTFDFTRPVYRGFKTRLYVANIIVPTALVLTAAGFLDALLVGVTVGLGWAPPPWWATVPPALIAANLSTAVFNVWGPVGRRLVAKRLAAQGVSHDQLRTGIELGISDPGRSDWKKAVLEDDVGMLWIEPARLTYRGDVDEFSAAPAELSRIERVSVGASLAAYFGVRHIVLHLQDGRRIRLHVEGEWTLPGLRRSTDRLADRLARWKAAAAGQLTAASA
jgi:hypothetical protein